MTPAIWLKAIQVIPRPTREEWERFDPLAKWLVSTRAAVLVMTLFSAIIAGLLAAEARAFHAGAFALVLVGLVLAHATNNLVNDLTDFRKGVDKDNYFRTMYGPQPLEHGLMSPAGHMRYIVATGLLALACGAALVWMRGAGVAAFFGAGVFFVLFYTWPLKYIGLGEVAVLLVWGPLMTGGGYLAITGHWSWAPVWASLPYAFAVTAVLFGKHIDKLDADKAKGIRTLPVLLGEKPSRYAVLAMLGGQYVLVVAYVVAGLFTPVVLVALLAAPTLRTIWQIYRAPRPATCPDKYPADIWPLYFVAAAFLNVRRFGGLFLLGLAGDAIWKLW